MSLGRRLISLICARSEMPPGELRQCEVEMITILVLVEYFKSTPE